MKKTKIFLLICLVAYGLQVLFTLYYTRDILIATRPGMEIYHKRDSNPYDWTCNPLKYIPAAGLVSMFARHDNTFIFRFRDGTTVEMPYEAWDESAIDFDSFQVESGEDGTSVYYDNCDVKKEFIFKLQKKDIMNY